MTTLIGKCVDAIPPQASNDLKKEMKNMFDSMTNMMRLSDEQIERMLAEAKRAKEDAARAAS